jgi:predicted dehydrogenase
MKEKKIRVGVLGVGRGMTFAEGAGELVGMELVALCDKRVPALEEAARQREAWGQEVTTYTDYEKFLEHDLDAVILANYFHEHTPFAIRALDAGKHVMSETAACFTMAQGVALVEAVERSGKIYMFAENYPYVTVNQEMRRLFQAGKIGTFRYGEGEYVHPGPADFWNSIAPGVDHWRNWCPATYYCSHALAPIMFITDTRPVKVNGFVMPHPEDDPTYQRRPVRSDAGSMIAVRMDNGAVVKLFQGFFRGGGIWVRIHGATGQMENLRHGDWTMLRVRREQYHESRTEPEEVIYRPDFPEHGDLARQAAGDSEDFFMNHHFAQAIRTGEQPYLDVYRGVAMSAVGIQSFKSAHQDSKAFEIPDFRDKAIRAKYAKDNWSPDPTNHKKGDPWPSVFGKREVDEKALKYARKVWEAHGYEAE